MQNKYNDTHLLLLSQYKTHRLADDTTITLLLR